MPMLIDFCDLLWENSRTPCVDLDLETLLVDNVLVEGVRVSRCATLECSLSWLALSWPPGPLIFNVVCHLGII